MVADGCAPKNLVAFLGAKFGLQNILGGLYWVAIWLAND